MWIIGVTGSGQVWWAEVCDRTFAWKSSTMRQIDLSGVEGVRWGTRATTDSPIRYGAMTVPALFSGRTRSPASAGNLLPHGSRESLR